MLYSGVIADPWGNEKAIFSAQTTINREDWGLTWNAPLEAGGWLVGKEVQIEIEAEAARA
jgi:polyisoprenoid-binding protein YceI